MKGFFPIWQKDDKVWIEIPVERLDQPFFFSYNISDLIGERFAYASQMGRRHLVVFHRLGNAMQLIAKNTRFAAIAGSPAERAVRQSFSDSLVGSAPVISQPHPDKKSVLVDASALFMTDIPGYSTLLEAAFHINYGLDRANSSFVKVRADESIATFSVRDHFSTPRLPGIIAPNNPFAPAPPTTTPDARSFFVGFVYSLAALPEPMTPRVADDRVGYFTTTSANYTTDNALNPRKHFINRWRLEKKNPEAPLSDPRQPIVFWVDRNVPVQYRDTIIEGILVWNKAFERIGFSNVIVAKIQPDDADLDTLGLRHNFRASTIRTPAQLRDAAFTRTNGMTGSVMDYTPLNIALQNERQGEYVMSGLGPYDYWAIEYGYKPLAVKQPGGEGAALARIAARNTEPELAFATDEDVDAGP